MLQGTNKLVTLDNAGVYRSGRWLVKGILDPLGSSIENGPDLYFQLIRDMSSSLKECLASD